MRKILPYFCFLFSFFAQSSYAEDPPILKKLYQSLGWAIHLKSNHDDVDLSKIIEEITDSIHACQHEIDETHLKKFSYFAENHDCKGNHPQSETIEEQLFTIHQELEGNNFTCPPIEKELIQLAKEFLKENWDTREHSLSSTPIPFGESALELETLSSSGSSLSLSLGDPRDHVPHFFDFPDLDSRSTSGRSPSGRGSFTSTLSSLSISNPHLPALLEGPESPSSDEK